MGGGGWDSGCVQKLREIRGWEGYLRALWAFFFKATPVALRDKPKDAGVNPKP